MDQESGQNAGNVEAETRKKLHWLEVGYFSSQIVLAVIGVWALTIYHGQLTAMKDQLGEMQQATKATQDAVTVASNTLTETTRSNQTQELLNRTSLRTTIGNFHLEQRAYLIPGNPEDTSGYGLLRFPIINYGHTTASHIKIFTHFERITVDLSTSVTALVDRRELSVQDAPTIPPSEKPTFYMLVFIPAKGSNDYSIQLANGEQTLSARGTIEYDTGFGESDTIAWCYSWKPRPAHWDNCGGSASVWLDNAPNTNQQTNVRK